MIILHAAQSDVGLLLWGEAPFDAAASPSASKVKKSVTAHRVWTIFS